MRFHHIALSVKNLEESKKFYQENFGFKEINRFTKEGWDGEAIILARDDLRMELFCFNNFTDTNDDFSQFDVIGMKHFSFKVNSVDEAYHQFKEKGLDIKEPQKGTTCAKFCFLRDPSGIMIELYEE